MTVHNAQKLTRKAIDSLKSRGEKWLMENIEYESKAMQQVSQDNKPGYEIYISAMRKALKELSNTAASK